MCCFAPRVLTGAVLECHQAAYIAEAATYAPPASNESAAMMLTANVPLREIADTTKRVSAPPASSPSDWPWSSWRFYFLEDESILAMDRMP